MTSLRLSPVSVTAADVPDLRPATGRPMFRMLHTTGRNLIFGALGRCSWGWLTRHRRDLFSSERSSVRGGPTSVAGDRIPIYLRSNPQ